MSFGPENAQNWDLRKPHAAGPGGAVASQNAIAAEVGAQVLREGGNAVDAAIATSFAVSIVEPWMSGLGGGGYMLVYLAKEDRVWVVDFGMIAPKTLDPSDYPLVDGDGAGDLFQWPAVLGGSKRLRLSLDGRPDTVAGIALAHEQFASKSWSELIAPAGALAEGGLPVNWFTTLRISATAGDLRRFETSNTIYLDNGLPPAPFRANRRHDETWANWPIPLNASPGPAHGISMKAPSPRKSCGTRMWAAAVLACKTLHPTPQRSHEAMSMTYAGATVYAAPGLTAGPTMFDTLSRIDGKIAFEDGSPSAESYAHYASALRAAYETRLATMGDADDAQDPACTTHLTTIDGERQYGHIDPNFVERVRQ